LTGIFEEEMLSLEAMLQPLDAEALILDHTPGPNPDRHLQTLTLAGAIGRITAQAVTSALDFPHWDNSAMDGYAVRYGDAIAGAVLNVTLEIPAGKAPEGTLGPNQAARIFTGAMLPEGADTIVMQEHTERLDGQVKIVTAPETQGMFVRSQGSYCREGDQILGSGVRLGGAELAVLAAAQVAEVAVWQAPRVGVFSTGDELVGVDAMLQPGQIVDSNRLALVGILQQMGLQVMDFGVVPDQLDRLRETMKGAIASCDIVISSGGVSVGDYDYVEGLLGELGGEVLVRSVAVKPGKPLTVAKFGQCLYFGLPGNPVSAMVTFWRFVRPALLKRSGLRANLHLPRVWGETTKGLKGDRQRETYLWGQHVWTEQGLVFTPAGGSHSSGNLINLAGTTALGIVPVGMDLGEGDRLEVLVLNG
jgi:molybdopterin molybdotransferase